MHIPFCLGCVAFPISLDSPGAGAQASSLWMNPPPVAHRSKLTSNDKEEYHHDRVEEAQDKAEDILMDD